MLCVSRSYKQESLFIGSMSKPINTLNLCKAFSFISIKIWLICSKKCICMNELLSWMALLQPDNLRATASVCMITAATGLECAQMMSWPAGAHEAASSCIWDVKIVMISSNPYRRYQGLPDGQPTHFCFLSASHENPISWVWTSVVTNH